MNKPEIMSTVEWQARCDLAALYRLIAHFRMTDLIDTQRSLRLEAIVVGLILLEVTLTLYQMATGTTH